MNKTLSTFARTKIKEYLLLCTKKQQHIFRCMYSPKKMNLLLDTIVDNMPDEKLDWGMIQLENTVNGNLNRENEI